MIARKVGYQDGSYFPHAFKQEKNLTPTEFRHRALRECVKIGTESV